MSRRYMRHRIDGTIYEWSEFLATNPLVVEVSEEQAFPEKFVKPEMVEKVQQSRAKRKTKLDLATDVVPTEPAISNPELEADASRNLPE